MQQIRDSKIHNSKDKLANNNRIKEIENEAKQLDYNLYKKLQLFKICDGMDDISLSQKEKSISFAYAMVAIEDLHPQKFTMEQLNNWKNGNITFFSIFENVLKKYGFIDE